jgi:hypothetical protein
VTQVDCVLDKALRVLGHAELFEPGRNLLQGSAPLWRTFAALQKDTIRRKAIVNSSGASPKPRLQSAAARVATAKGS